MAKKSAKKTKSSSKSVMVDFEGTESRAGKKSERGAHVPEGDYAVKVTKARIGKSSEKETPGVFASFKVLRGKQKGKVLTDRFWLSKKALWRVRQLWEACGVKVPSKKVKLDPSKLVGKELAITAEDEEYDDKIRTRIADTFLLSDLEELEETDEDLEEDEDEEDEEGEDEDEEDEDEEDEDEDEDEDLDLDEI